MSIKTMGKIMLLDILFWNLENETNLVHDLFLVYFVSFIYNLYMFRNSPGPSSGGNNLCDTKYLLFWKRRVV